MFWRLLWQLLRGSRGRLVVAFIALVSGAAVISALLNVQLDVGRKLTQEFRTLGANLVISPGRFPEGAALQGEPESSPQLMEQEAALDSIARLHTTDLSAAAPYLYVVAHAGKTSVVVAGTWLDTSAKISPTWQVEGSLVASRYDRTHCLIGRAVARQLQISPGGNLQLNYMGRTANLEVAGVMDAGGAEDNQVFVNLPVAQDLAGLPAQISLIQLSVSGTPESIASVLAQLQSDLPQLQVRPIRQVTEAEGSLLKRIRLLIISMVILILTLTALCVLGTMAALAMERRADVGLMKALGGSIARIVGLFLAEVGVLGAAGGIIGWIFGVALSHWMGQRVFGTNISARWEILPLTILLMTLVALAGASPLRLLGNVKPAVILRGE